MSEIKRKLPYLFGFKYLLVETDLDEWCEKWGLHPFSVVCDECGETRHVNIPFASKEFNRRGLLAYDCSCGKGSFCYKGDDLNSFADISGIEPTLAKKSHLELVKNEPPKEPGNE